MQSSRKAEEDKILSSIPVITDKVLYQLCSGMAFERMFKLVASALRVMTFVLAKDDKDFTIPVCEAPQYQWIGEHVKERFIARHVRKQSVGNLFAFTDHEKDVYYVLYEDVIDVDTARETGSKKLPVEFRKKFGKVILLNLFVNKNRDGTVLYMQVEDKTELHEARDNAMHFGYENTYACPKKMCTGCKLKMPVTKKCKVCCEPFCSKACMKEAWTTHKAVCKPPEEAASIADAMSKVSLVESSADRCPCGGPGSHICTRCRKQWYCSKECQTACWNSHSFVCKKAESTQQPTQQPTQPACPKCGAAMDAEGAMGALCSACSR